MTAVELVATLRARGVELVPAGDRLRFRPGEAVTHDEREALRHYKAEVLALLAPLALDPTTLRTVFGPRLEPAAVAALEAEVRAAIAQYQVEVATGVARARPASGPRTAGLRLPRPRHARAADRRAGAAMTTGPPGRTCGNHPSGGPNGAPEYTRRCVGWTAWDVFLRKERSRRLLALQAAGAGQSGPEIR